MSASTANKMPLELDAHWLVREPSRLAMMTFLIEGPRSFWEMQQEFGINNGTLHKHADRLEAVGYLGHHSIPSLGRTRTIYHLTRDGLDALVEYAVTATAVNVHLRSALTSTAR